MKKLLLLLTLTLVLTCLVSCGISNPDHTTGSSDPEQTNSTTGSSDSEQTNSTTDSSDSEQTNSTTDSSNSEQTISPSDTNFIVPTDEEAALRTVSQTNEDGLKFEITVHGYKSDILGKDFYVKNNEYFIVDIKLTNESDIALYQSLPTYCHEMSPPHNHEIGFDLSHGKTKLHSSSFGFSCPAMFDCWTIEAGKSYEWQLKLAAGEQQSGEQDLPGDATGSQAGIKLYEKDIFADNICVFDGSFFFDYTKNKDQYGNDFSISIPFSIEVVYVSHIANK